MPLDPDIPFRAIAGLTKAQPYDPVAVQTDIDRQRVYQAAGQKAQREMALEAQKQQIAQQYAGDPDKIADELSRLDPMEGEKYRGQVWDTRTKVANAYIEQSKQRQVELSEGIDLLNTADETNWPTVSADFLKKYPAMAPVVQGQPYSPELVQRISSAAMSEAQRVNAKQEAAKLLMNKDSVGFVATMMASADTPQKQAENARLFPMLGMAPLAARFGDAASAQAYLDRQKKDDPTSDTSWQLKETMVGGKRSWVWANPKTQEVKPADPALGAPVPPASLIVQNQNAGAVAASVPGQMRTTLSGKQYIDLGDFGTPKEQAAARAAAEKAGIMAVDKQTGASLKALDTAKQNAMSIWSSIKEKLPKDAQGRLTAAPGNKLKAYFQTDADLASFGSWRTAAIQQVQALAEPGMGLRINQAEIKQAMDNDIPQITDDVATAAQRIKNLMTMLSHKENDALTRNRSTLVTGPSTAPKANPFLKK